jgi:hypothetical protein
MRRECIKGIIKLQSSVRCFMMKEEYLNFIGKGLNALQALKINFVLLT